jgi:hypothetical protein
VARRPLLATRFPLKYFKILTLNFVRFSSVLVVTEVCQLKREHVGLECYLIIRKLDGNFTLNKVCSVSAAVMSIKILHVLSHVQLVLTTSFLERNGLLLCRLLLVTEYQTTLKSVLPVKLVSTKTVISPLDPIPGTADFMIRFYLDRRAS